MNNWEIALNEFLSSWRKREEVIGALVCGSFVTGKPALHSDIDLHIVLSEDVLWRERGNRVVDGFLIEYFANPPRQIREYFKEDYADNRLMAATQFTTGKIIFDREGVINQLKKEAIKWRQRRYKRLNRPVTELRKYGLWDCLDNLQDALERGAPDFIYVYHNSLRVLFDTYAKYLRQPIPQFSKTYDFLTDAWTRKKYQYTGFPDKRFVNLFAKAITETDKKKMCLQMERLTEHIHNNMGDFKIDGWKVRSLAVKKN
jgi:hypothetical protein